MIKPEILTLPVAVDIHTHLRWPSPLNKSEDYETGTKAAAESGWGMLCDMPNTQGRPTWSWQEADYKIDGIRQKAWIPMAIYAGSQPEKDNIGELEKMSGLCAALKIYFGHTTGNEGIKETDLTDYEPIVAEWHRVAPDKPIMVHRGNADLLGIIELIALKHNHPLHICHVNSPDEVRIVKKAKNIDLPVTCGVTPHHLFKTSHDVFTGGWNLSMQPPLAHQDDAEELWRMLANGDIDCIETDHAPHPPENKRHAEEVNPHHEETAEPGATCYGVRGLKETMPQLLYQLRLGRISLERLVEVTSAKPAEIIGVRISPGSQVTYQLEFGEIDEPLSIYRGNQTSGKVLRTIISGTIVYDNGSFVNQVPTAVTERDTVI